MTEHDLDPLILSGSRHPTAVKQELHDAITNANSRRGAETRRNGTTKKTSLRLSVSAGKLTP